MLNVIILIMYNIIYFQTNSSNIINMLYLLAVLPFIRQTTRISVPISHQKWPLRELVSIIF